METMTETFRLFVKDIRSKMREVTIEEIDIAEIRILLEDAFWELVDAPQSDELDKVIVVEADTE